MSTEAATTQLDSLKQYTKVVADTGDFETMRDYQPQDATTNPTLVLKALGQERYRPLLDKAIADKKGTLSGDALIEEIMDEVLINFGEEILKIVPGRVSTEVDAKLSFDVEGSVEKAKQLIGLYEARGIGKERILIKLASTWEGVKAAEILQKEGINCNMTLLFSLVQAVACAEVGARLISPFVGRILDWYKASTGEDYQGADDPGVKSVKEIYTYYKHFGYETEVMGASFRNTSEIVELCGCDLLTISPGLLKELAAEPGELERKLDPEAARSAKVERIDCSEKNFRFLLNEDQMATEKLSEGIRKFNADARTLEAEIQKHL
mgnify:CR=1 FL=1